MARVKLSALFTAIRGRYAGGVFRDWNGRTTLAALPSSIQNHYTEHQVKYRAVLGVCSKSWSLLSLKERDAWEAFAVYLSEQWGNFNNEVGTRSLISVPRGPFSGIDALISVHSLLFSCNLWFPHQHLRSAPVGVSAPTLPEIVNVRKTPTGIRVQWSTITYWGKNATPGMVRIWARSENGVFYPQLDQSHTPVVNSSRIPKLRPVGGAAKIFLTTGVYHVQMDAVNNEGLRSAPSLIATVLW